MIDNKNKSFGFAQDLRGFSLVEAIIYLAIVGILLTAVVSLHLTLGGTTNKLGSNILASRNRRVALSGIDYLVKNSEGMLRDVHGNCSDFSATPEVLSLYFENDTYLPGTCVENGGGVRISVADKKVSLTCYPNMNGNGHYQNCDTSVYTAENVYYLSSPDVVVLDSSLSFSTSTATSTSNNFLTVSSKLSVGTQSGDQVRLTATSTATSTATLKNTDDFGLVSWWKIETGSTFDNDEQGLNDLSCFSVGGPSGLINDSTAGVSFGSAGSCVKVSPASLGFNNSFTIATWININSQDSDDVVFMDQSTSTYEGYGLYVDSGVPTLSICDSVVCGEYVSSLTLSNSISYHVAATYDLENDEVIIYTYKEGGTEQTTSTSNSLKTLVNYNSVLLIGNDNKGKYFDGTLDDIRVYNRVLEPAEIWALQSQGATAN